MENLLFLGVPILKHITVSARTGVIKSCRNTPLWLSQYSFVFSMSELYDKANFLLENGYDNFSN